MSTEEQYLLFLTTIFHRGALCLQLVWLSGIENVFAKDIYSSSILKHGLILISVTNVKTAMCICKFQYVCCRHDTLASLRIENCIIAKERICLKLQSNYWFISNDYLQKAVQFDTYFCSLAIMVQMQSTPKQSTAETSRKCLLKKYKPRIPTKVSLNKVINFQNAMSLTYKLGNTINYFVTR